MTVPSDAIRRFAEEPDGEIDDPPPPTRRIRRPNFTLVLSPTPSHASVSRVRTSPAQLDETIAEVRALLREAGYTGCAWYVGPSCRPDGLVERLLERGFAPATLAPYEPLFTAMVLATPPPQPRTPGVESRTVRDLDEYLRALRVGMDGFNEAPGDAAHWLEAAPALWNHPNSLARLTHAAFLDGRMVGFGFVAPGPSAVLLGGSAVLPEARGRGVYRALIASRWREAVKLGKPAMVVHAGSMSRPILERCGFHVVSRVDVLSDLAVG